MIGSGKTTLADQYRKDPNFVVISLDCLYRGQDKENMNVDTAKINELLMEKFPRKVTFVLEGQQIYRYLDLKDIKGKLIIKRTSILKCWYRSILRHIRRKRKQLKSNRITRIEYDQNIWYWIKKRTKQLKYYKRLNQFLDYE